MFSIERFKDMEVRGSLVNNNKVVELDVELVGDPYHHYFMNVMTLNRFEQVRSEDLDLGYDADAPRTFVINDESLAVHSLRELVTSVSSDFFAPYVLETEA